MQFEVVKSLRSLLHKSKAQKKALITALQGVTAHCETEDKSNPLKKMQNSPITAQETALHMKPTQSLSIQLLGETAANVRALIPLCLMTSNGKLCNKL